MKKSKLGTGIYLGSGSNRKFKRARSKYNRNKNGFAFGKKP